MLQQRPRAAKKLSKNKKAKATKAKKKKKNPTQVGGTASNQKALQGKGNHQQTGKATK